MTTALSVSEIKDCIHHVRDSEIFVDSDLARFYEVSTKKLNVQVSRNPDRFPKDFVCQLVSTEYDCLRSQFATLDV